MKKFYLLILAIVISLSAFAQLPGSFDSTFAEDGKAFYNFSENTFARTLLLDASGKILIGGTSGNRYFITRINADSTTDLTFGNNGVTGDSIIGFNTNLTTMKLDSNGAIVVTLMCFDISFVNGIYGYARYTSAGILDTTFGTNGYVMHYHPAGELYKNYIFPVTDNKYVLLESLSDFNNQVVTTTLTGLFYDGTIDTTFGNGGTVQLQAIGLESAALTTDNKILLYAHYPFFATSSLLMRFNSKGMIDSSYGLNGIVTDSILPATSFYTLFTDSFGNAFTTFTWGLAPYVMRITKFDSMGVKDTSFGNLGIIDLSSDRIVLAMAFQDDGKIIAAGGIGSGPLKESLLMRWMPDGNPDSTFGNAGEVIYTTGTNYETIDAVLLDSTNRIYALTNTQTPVNNNFFILLSRFNNSTITGITDSNIGPDSYLVYPNPAHSFLYIKNLTGSAMENATVSIATMQGQIVYFNKGTSGFNKINIIHLNPGLYNLSIETSNKVLNNRFIKAQ